MPSLSPSPSLQFFDANGNPLAGGKLYTYESGTTTPLATYANKNGLPNSNPVTLNYRGEANIWLDSKLYTFVLTNAFGDVIWTVNDIGTVTITGIYNVRDYGAVGDGVTDDTAAFQAAITAATAGGVIYAPAGDYKITANLNITWPKLCVLRGDGSKLTRLLDYRTDVSTGGLVNYNCSSFAGNDNAYLSTWTGGFSCIRSINQTIVTGAVITTLGTGTGIWLDGVVGGVYTDIAVRGYSKCIYGIDILGFTMQDMILNECNHGIYLAGYSLLSGPNASTIENAIISACASWGIYINGGMVRVIAGTYAFCGTMGTPKSGAIYCGGDVVLPLPQDVTISDAYFEANRGGADVYIENTLTYSFSATVENCLFARIDGSYYATNNIYAVSSSTGTVELNAFGNGFRGYGSYVANSGRKYIETSGAVEHNYIGNTYSDATEAPTATATNFTTIGFGSLGARLTDVSGTPVMYTPTNSIGVSNSAGAMVLDTTSWRPAIAGTFSLGTNTYPVSAVYFGALGGRLVDVAGAPFLYTSSTSVGVSNSTGAVVLDATSWRPAIANTFALGTSTYPFASAAITGTFRWGSYNISAPTGSTTTFLRNDGTWATPSGGTTATDYTYTGTVTGLTTSPTGTIKYTRVGSIVTMDLFGAVGTSNATTMTITGGTTNMRPAVDKQVLMGVIDGGLNSLGLAIIRTTGVIEFYKDIVGDPFLSTGIKGFANNSISYTVA